MDWFESLLGFPESAYTSTQARLKVHLTAGGAVLKSLVNEAEFNIGNFSCPTLKQLRTDGAALLPSRKHGEGLVEVIHVAVGSALEEHARHPYATFQAASQFNCLEFPSPSTTPEQGVAVYAFDGTQGPDCALACAAGTLFRNYLVPVGGGQIGQTVSNQINNLDELELLVDNARHGYWKVCNGYISTLGEGDALLPLAEVVSSRRDELMSAVKIGVHADVGVTFARRWDPPTLPVTVTQAYCSALSLGMYSRGVPLERWEPLARLVLDAAYEATLWAAVAAAARTGVRDVFLTSVGGGVFSNPFSWIAAAIGRAVAVVESAGAQLRVHVCHHRRVDDAARNEVDRELHAWRSKETHRRRSNTVRPPALDTASIGTGGMGDQQPPRWGEHTRSVCPLPQFALKFPELYPIDSIGDPVSLAGPTRESNWVIGASAHHPQSGRLIAGAYPGDVDVVRSRSKLAAILAAGVRTFVCLQSELNPELSVAEWERAPVGFRPYIADAASYLSGALARNSASSSGTSSDQQGLDFIHFPIPDGGTVDDASALELARLVVQRLSAGETVYLHCWGGHGRTGTIAAIVVRLLYGVSAEDAMAWVQHSHGHRGRNANFPTPETDQQRKQVDSAPRLLEEGLQLSPGPVAARIFRVYPAAV